MVLLCVQFQEMFIFLNVTEKHYACLYQKSVSDKNQICFLLSNRRERLRPDLKCLFEKYSET